MGEEWQQVESNLCIQTGWGTPRKKTTNFASPCSTQEAGSTPPSGLAYLQAFSLCACTNPGFEESHIILKPNSEGTKATPLSPSQNHHQTPKLNEEDITLRHCVGIISIQIILHQRANWWQWRHTLSEFFITHEIWRKLRMKYPMQPKKCLWD